MIEKKRELAAQMPQKEPDQTVLEPLVYNEPSSSIGTPSLRARLGFASHRNLHLLPVIVLGCGRSKRPPASSLIAVPPARIKRHSDL